jgi:hypothetical protein
VSVRAWTLTDRCQGESGWLYRIHYAATGREEAMDGGWVDEWTAERSFGLILPGAVVEQSIIHANAVIGQGAHVVHSDIAGHSSISASVVAWSHLEEVEMNAATVRDSTLRWLIVNGARIRDAGLSGTEGRRGYFAMPPEGIHVIEGVDLLDGWLAGWQSAAATTNYGPAVHWTSCRDVLLVGPVGSRSDRWMAWRTIEGWWVSTGCFHDSVAEFRRKLARTHEADSLWGREYHAVLDLLGVRLDERDTTQEEA